MTPAILLVTMSLQRASKQLSDPMRPWRVARPRAHEVDDRYADLRDEAQMAEVMRALPSGAQPTNPPRFQWCQPYARSSEVYAIHGPPDLSEVSRTYEDLPYRK
jgi:hypothetical protein